MKKKILLLSALILVLTSCSLSKSNEDENNQVEVTIYHWNLINVSGGIAGVDIDFEVGDIVWNYDQFENILYVTNTNEDSTLEDGLDTGNYQFYIISTNNKNYTFLDSDEYGEVYIPETDSTILIIDQNSTSTGPNTDGFIYTFKITTTTTLVDV